MEAAIYNGPHAIELGERPDPTVQEPFADASELQFASRRNDETLRRYTTIEIQTAPSRRLGAVW